LEKIEDLNEEIASLKVKEQRLMQEIKKRGDLARQLCSAKDEEIKQLREKLHFDQRQQQQAAAISPNQGRKSVPPPDQQETPEHCNGHHPPSPSSQERGGAKSQSTEPSDDQSSSTLSINTQPSHDATSQASGEISSIHLTEEDVTLSSPPSISLTLSNYSLACSCSRSSGSSPH
jgi:hypothetical protein